MLITSIFFLFFWKKFFKILIFIDLLCVSFGVQQSDSDTHTHTYLLLFYLLSRVWLFGDPMDYSPPGSSVHEVLQARILEQVAISFSRGFLTQGLNLYLLQGSPFSSSTRSGRISPPDIIFLSFFPLTSHQCSSYCCTFKTADRAAYIFSVWNYCCARLGMIPV